MNNFLQSRRKAADFAGDQNSKLINQLNFDSAYPCPVCRLGQIRNLSLMDAFACDLCNHIFEANLDRQQLKMVARQPPLIWCWNGRHWIEPHLEGMELGWGYILAAIALVALPTTLIGLTLYAFPPTADTPLSWVPYVWAGLTFLSHLGIIVWLVIEIYQFPVGVYLRAIRQRLLSR
jgi:hypothetical protein